MRFLIKATNYRLTAAIRTYIEEKIGELEKFTRPSLRSLREFPGGRDTVEARVEVGKTTQHHRHGNVFRAEVTLRLPRQSFRAAAQEQDLRLALDRVRDELQRELKKDKGKLRAQMLRGARKAKRTLRFSRLARFPGRGRIRLEG